MKNTGLLLLTLAVFASHAFAQLKSGDNIVISERVNQDLYIAAGTVSINAPVYGDLIIVGGTVNINDTIMEDLNIAGGEIVINGNVKDDIRCAGGKVRIKANVDGDVVAAGGTLNIDKGVTIKGNLFVTGGDVILDGEVKELVKDASGTFTLNGTAGSDIDCKGGKIIINGIVAGNSTLAASNIEVGSMARFNKNVRYWSDNENLDFKNSLINSKATFDSSLKMESGKWHYLGFASLVMVLWYLGTALIMIFIIEFLFSVTIRKSADTVKQTSLKSLGLGFLFFIAMPVAIVITAVTIIGLPIGMLLLLGYILVLLLATVIVSLLIANWINNTYYESAWKMRKIGFAAFGIFILLKLISLTPFIGPLIMIVLVFMSVGGILQNIHWRRHKELTLT